MALTLQFIQPVDERFIPLGPGRRKAWSHPALAERFADLLRWRDQLYAEHRPAPVDRQAGERVPRPVCATRVARCAPPPQSWGMTACSRRTVLRACASALLASGLPGT